MIQELEKAFGDSEKEESVKNENLIGNEAEKEETNVST
jgi:hypothetical protein